MLRRRIRHPGEPIVLKTDGFWNLVVYASTIFAGFAVQYSIDESLFDVPAKFNLTSGISQMLGLIFLQFPRSVGGHFSMRRSIRLLWTDANWALLTVADIFKHDPEMLKLGCFRSDFV